MKPKPALLATVLGILLLASAHPAECRTFTISWDNVTAYTDNSPISGVAVSYTIYWTTDPALTPSSLTLNRICEPSLPMCTEKRDAAACLTASSTGWPSSRPSRPTWC